MIECWNILQITLFNSVFNGFGHIDSLWRIKIHKIHLMPWKLWTMRHKCFHATQQPMHKQQRLKSLRMSKYSGQFCLHPLSKDLQPAGARTVFLESLRATGKHNRSTQSEPSIRQANTARQRYPEYTRTNIDNTRLGTIWHESELKRSDLWATMCIS